MLFKSLDLQCNLSPEHTLLQNYLLRKERGRNIVNIYMMYIFQNFSPYAYFFLFLHKCNSSEYTILHPAFFLPWFQMYFPCCNIISDLSTTNNNNTNSIDCIFCCGPDMASGAPYTAPHLFHPVCKVVVISSTLQIKKLRLRELRQLVNNNWTDGDSIGPSDFSIHIPAMSSYLFPSF